MLPGYVRGPNCLGLAWREEPGKSGKASTRPARLCIAHVAYQLGTWKVSQAETVLGLYAQSRRWEFDHGAPSEQGMNGVSKLDAFCRSPSDIWRIVVEHGMEEYV